MEKAFREFLEYICLPSTPLEDKNKLARMFKELEGCNYTKAKNMLADLGRAVDHLARINPSE